MRACAPCSRPVRLGLDIDPASRRNLELFTTQSGQAKGSLFALINRAVTAAGRGGCASG